MNLWHRNKFNCCARHYAYHFKRNDVYSVLKRCPTLTSWAGWTVRYSVMNFQSLFLWTSLNKARSSQLFGISFLSFFIVDFQICKMIESTLLHHIQLKLQWHCPVVHATSLSCISSFIFDHYWNFHGFSLFQYWIIHNAFLVRKDRFHITQQCYTDTQALHK